MPVEDGVLTTVEQEIERATLEVFTVQVGFDVVSELPGDKPRGREKYKLVSSLRLSGSVRGAAQVRYTLPMATCITCRLLEAEPPVATESIFDAMGEVANMIVGNVKSSLENQWGTIRIGIPIAGVLADPSLDLASMGVDFRWNDETFSVLLAFQPAMVQGHKDSGIDQWDADGAAKKEDLVVAGRCFGTTPAD